MKPHLEVWQRQTTECFDCGGQRVVYNGEAGVDHAASAIFWAFLYDHPDAPEVFIDATFGTLDIPGYAGDHVTFGSRTGEVEAHPHIASSLVTGAALAGNDPRFGLKLTREAALSHRQLEEFWLVNDVVLTQIDEIGELLTGRRPRRRWPWRRR